MASKFQRIFVRLRPTGRSGCLVALRRSRRATSALVIGLLWLMAAHLPAAAQTAAPPPAAPTQAGDLPEFVPGELVVGFYSERMAGAVLSAGLDLRAARTLDVGGVQAAYQGQPVVAQVVPVAPGQELAMAEELAANPAVAFAHPNWLVYAAGVQTAGVAPETAFAVNDPLYAGKQWYLQRIGASRAWPTAFGGAGVNEVRVAIIDSGIDDGHPELAGRVEAGRNYTDVPMADECGHGTHVAGLVGATLNDGRGIAGLSPQARLIPYKVLRWMSVGSGQACAGPVSGLVSAIYAAVNNDGADVINMSLEIGTDSAFLRTAVAYAQEKGVLMVAAAGNSGISSVAYPARYPQVMAVAATNYGDLRPFYSNIGAEIEIAAPGGDSVNPIFGAWSADAALRCSGYTVQDGGGYCNTSGTSMAAGLVTGAAALLWSMAPGLNADQVRAALRDAATPLGLDPRWVGSGRLNVQGAVRRAVPSDLTVSQALVGATVSLVDPPRTVALRLDNPSADPIAWTAALVAARPWITLQSAVAGQVTGQATYGKPGYVTLLLTPAQLPGAGAVAELQVVGQRTDGSSVVRTVSIQMSLAGTPSHQVYVPYVTDGEGTLASSAWETPMRPADRTPLAMTDDSNVAVALPFSFPLGGQQFDSARIYSDGFVAFPAGDFSTALPNRCLGDASSPQQAVYGWWTDLNPGAAAAQVSLFQPAAGRYVVEFQDVPTAASVTPGYRVTFQIVLYADGRVGLNYHDTPAVPGAAPAPVTVGVESRDGRFYNQVTCVTGVQDLGGAPASSQRFLLQPEEIY